MKTRSFSHWGVPSLLSLFLLAGCGADTTLSQLPRIKKNTKTNLMLTLVNKARSEGTRCGEENMPSVAPLVWNETLEKAAYAHAEDMRANNYFSHDGLDGSSVSDRVDRTGYRWSTVGENIARGQQSVEEVVQGWLDSPGHCRNIMNGAFMELGASRSGLVWVQVFGSPR